MKHKHFDISGQMYVPHVLLPCELYLYCLRNLEYLKLLSSEYTEGGV